MLSSDQFFTFGPTVSSHSLSIDITNDDIFEAKSENFLIGLSTDTTELRRLRFLSANLTIKDDDSKLKIHRGLYKSVIILFLCSSDHWV